MSSEQIRMEAAQEPPASTDRSTPQAETANPEPKASATDHAARTKPTDPNLGDELRVFGKQMEALFQTARHSPRGKEIQQQLTAAWRDVERGINNAINSAQAADLKGTVTGTAQYAADEVQSGMARGLRSLNQWMAERVREAEERRRKREEEIARGATQGAADNEVQDRFGADEPVFGQGVTVPETPVHPASESPRQDEDNPIAERFQ